jgi:hypothetical protein
VRLFGLATQAKQILHCHSLLNIAPGGIGRATFDLEELKRFVQETKDTRLVVRNEAGEIIGILQVQPIREFLALEEPAEGTCPSSFRASL